MPSLVLLLSHLGSGYLTPHTDQDLTQVSMYQIKPNVGKKMPCMSCLGLKVGDAGEKFTSITTSQQTAGFPPVSFLEWKKYVPVECSR